MSSKKKKRRKAWLERESKRNKTTQWDKEYADILSNGNINQVLEHLRRKPEYE